jgi:hypothetical protein
MKPLLPWAYQDIEDPQLRQHFPIDRADPLVDMEDITAWLREHYTFQVIPNDYFKAKPNLPKDPSKIKTTNTYSFPITDDTIAKNFINEIKSTYKLTIPFPETIMTANPTDKPRLPVNPSEITDYNLTLPIDTPKRLTETARMLRQTYYFQKIPDSWIQITNGAYLRDSGLDTLLDQKPEIPDSIEKIQEELNTKDTEMSNIELPITQQNKATETLKTLREHYTIKEIPEFLLALPPLPEPNWGIFCPYAK